MNNEKVKEYIFKNWDNTIRTPDDVIHGSIKMPFNFTVPCMKDAFTDFYYWDTYFTNIGLILSNRIDLAESNLKTMKFFVDTLGFVPNANHITDRSQPPLFARGVFDLYSWKKDDEIIKYFIDALIKEHEYWTVRRSKFNGLCAYSTEMTDDELFGAIGICERVREPIPSNRKETIRLSRNIYAIAESGWDFTPRFDTSEGRFKTDEFVHVDLNSILYDEEIKISKMLQIIGRIKEASEFEQAAYSRKLMMNKFMLDKSDGIYKDYNFKTGKFSNIASVASLYPYALGVSDNKQSANALLARLEHDFGVSTCDKHDGIYLQWDYPAMWPPTTYFVFNALLNVGLKTEAKRVAQKYVDTVAKVFEETGSLWEKYDSTTGDVAVSSEYETPKMLGWTAGVFLYFLEVT